MKTERVTQAIHIHVYHARLKEIFAHICGNPPDVVRHTEAVSVAMIRFQIKQIFFQSYLGVISKSHCSAEGTDCCYFE